MARATRDDCVGFTVEREREKRLHSPFALHAPIQWAIQGDVIKKRG